MAVALVPATADGSSESFEVLNEDGALQKSREGLQRGGRDPTFTPSPQLSSPDLAAKKVYEILLDVFGKTAANKIHDPKNVFVIGSAYPDDDITFHDHVTNEIVKGKAFSNRFRTNDSSDLDVAAYIQLDQHETEGLKFGILFCFLISF